MKTPVLLAVLALTLGSAVAEEGLKDQTRPQVARPDETFLTEAWRRGQTMVRISQLATTQGGSDHVQQIGDQMVVDHSRMNEELKGIASQKALNIWGDPDNIRIAELRQLSGDAFDRAYLAEIVRMHERAIADFDQALRASSDPDVKAFIAKNLPALRTHLARVKRVATPEAVAPAKVSTGL